MNKKKDHINILLRIIKKIILNYELLTAATLTYTIGAGITAAAAHKIPVFFFFKKIPFEDISFFDIDP